MAHFKLLFELLDKYSTQENTNIFIISLMQIKDYQCPIV